MESLAGNPELELACPGEGGCSPLVPRLSPSPWHTAPREGDTGSVGLPSAGACCLPAVAWALGDAWTGSKTEKVPADMKLAF